MREFEEGKGVSVRRVGSGGDDRKWNWQGGAERWKRDSEVEREINVQPAEREGKYRDFQVKK